MTETTSLLKASASPAAGTSQLSSFTADLALASGRRFADYPALHDYSATEFRQFWSCFLEWCRAPLGFTGEAQPVCEGDAIEHARFFPQLRLNYADSLLNLSAAPAEAIALTQCHADGPSTRWTRGQLRDKVARVADGFARLGIGEGDRVVAVMRNDANAVVAALAATAVGASLSTASPDMGVEAILDRFGPLAPRLLLAHTAAQPFDQGMALAAKVQAVLQGLPALETLVLLDGVPQGTLRQVCLDELAASGEAAHFHWPQFEFNHPLFIMFSSGTTGKPKCIVHGAGGSLLEHVKEHRLHTDLRPGDRMYFHTSCSWMMWNWQLSALASGVEIVTYDGPIASVDTLWQLVARERVTVFGTSPAYLKMSEDAGLEPARQFELGALRAMLSTGAVLYDSQFDWVRRNVGPLPLQSISGGTDILGCFVLGNPDLPVVPGLAQCKSLGLDVQAWSEGAPLAKGIGMLVCARPFPSRPLGFFGDTDGRRFHAAYFSQNPGVWTHGDLIEFSPEGGARLHGRYDGVLNVRGIKIAPAEIYRVMDDFAEIQSAMVVEQRSGHAAGPVQRTVALLVMRGQAPLQAELVGRLRRDIARRLSSAHVPDCFLAVPELPATHNGKLSEAAARNAVSGLAVENTSALRNPQILDLIRQHPGLQATADPAGDEASDASLEERLRSLWQRCLHLDRIELDDNFFELGGNSLLAAAILGRVGKMTGRALPLAAMLHAPTVRQLAQLISQGVAVPSTRLVPMRSGTGRPLFLVHGLSGTVMECWPLVRSLRTSRPVFGLQACGIDGEQPPHDRVEAMAAVYVDAIRSEQPQGPYAIGGFSFGGLVALEMARRLAQAGETLEHVLLLDPHVQRDLTPAQRLWLQCLRALGKLSRLPAGERWNYLRSTLARVTHPQPAPLTPRGEPRPAQWDDMPAAQQAVYDGLMSALRTYRPQPYDCGPLVLVRARIPLEGYFNPLPVWRRVARAGLKVVNVPGAHLELVARTAPLVAAFIDQELGQAAGVDAAAREPARKGRAAAAAK